jgi:hypothetical protein
LFRRRARDQEWADQVKRLESEYRAAKEAGDTAALARIRDEVRVLLSSIVPVVGAHRDEQLASLLSDLARMSLPLEMDAGEWARAANAGTAMNLAVGTILDSLGDKGFHAKRIALGKLLLVQTREVAEAAAYAAHRAGAPVQVLGALEDLTNILLELRISVTVRRHVDRNLATRQNAETDMQNALLRRHEAFSAALRGATAATARQKNEEAILAVLSLPGLPDPLEQYFITKPDAHAVRAARLTERTLVYVVPGQEARDGVAIRVNRDRSERNLVESTLLPGLRADAVKSRTEAVRDAFRQDANGSIAPDDLDRVLLELQDWTGTTVWEVVLAAWPDLESQQLAAVPIGYAALLPLYTATVGGDPACTRMELTIAPSARALHYAAIQSAADPRPRPLVAADHWGEPDYLPSVDDEAAAVAAVYGATPVLCETDTETALGGHRSLRTPAGLPPPSLTPVSADIAARMSEATVVHLCCHGALDGDIAPALLLGGILQLTQVLRVGNGSDPGEQQELRGHPLVVLSACELGGFLAMGMPTEQAWFPGGFMAMGARAVVGSLWPVPDGRPTKRLMVDFHRRLAGSPSSTALSATIAQAHRSQIRPLVWGSLTHYGV